jgi:hypothetical protein
MSMAPDLFCELVKIDVDIRHMSVYIRHMEATQMTTLTQFQLISLAIACPAGIRADVYAQQVKKEAFRIVNGGKIDKTCSKIFGLPITHDYSAKVMANQCTRCGGAGKGNWGAVIGGVCYGCGGSGMKGRK